jgi:hypothetical protein
VLERVARQHHERPIEAQPAVEQSLGDRVGLLPGLTPGQRGAAARRRLAREDALRMGRGAGAEEVRHARRVRGEVVALEHHGPVVAGLGADVRRREDGQGAAGHGAIMSSRDASVRRVVSAGGRP